jgi:glycosyltransferase involved in cell wall biosynthesis
MMKILYLLPKPNFFTEGKRGRTTHAIGVINGLIKNGYDVYVITSSGLHQFNDQIIKAPNLTEVPQSGIFRFNLFWYLKFVFKFIALIKNENQISHVIIRYAVSNGFIFSILSRIWPRIKWIIEVNSLGYQQNRIPLELLRKIFVHFENRTIAKFHYIYVVSTFLKNDILSHSSDFPSEKILIIPNAGPESQFIKSDSTEISQANVRFMYLGMFQPYYEIELAINAFMNYTSTLTNAELYLCGDGPLYESLQNTYGQKENIIFYGRYHLPGLIEEEVLNSNTILLLPYSPNEYSALHSPIKLYEYMSLGLPIIASDTGQASEVLKQGKTAVLYKSRDIESLQTAMKIISTDIQLKRHITKNLKNEYTEKHTWEQRMKQLLAGIDDKK